MIKKLERKDIQHWNEIEHDEQIVNVQRLREILQDLLDNQSEVLPKWSIKERFAVLFKDERYDEDGKVKR